MGVCYLQHRVKTGLFTRKDNKSLRVHNKGLNPESKSRNEGAFREEIRRFIYSLILLLYALLLIMMITVANFVQKVGSQNTFTTGINFLHISTVGTEFGIRQLTSSWALIVISFLFRYKKQFLYPIFQNFGFPASGRFKNKGRFARIQIFLSFWITALNLLLIVITLPAMKNPGPKSEKLTCLYQNVRGFIPFSELSKKIPALDRNKLNDFQSYVYENKPGIVLLTETWLTHEHLNNEIFPNDTYRCFRLDRTPKTHPPDPLNKSKFREKGGGVLIAVRSDLKIEVKEVPIKSKAEIISLELNLGKKETVCITLCYRVGTLGVPNFAEIEKHLREIASKKKFSKHIVVGDFNFSKTDWLSDPSGNSTDRIENLFLDLFGDLGLIQLINGPTHQGGRTLDLVLASAESLVTDISVAGQHTVCHSDHYAITFRMKSRVEKVIKKRTALNFKKANWEGLNKALNSVKWDNIIGHHDSETAWKNFKVVLASLVENFYSLRYHQRE